MASAGHFGDRSSGPAQPAFPVRAGRPRAHGRRMASMGSPPTPRRRRSGSGGGATLPTGPTARLGFVAGLFVRGPPSPPRPGLGGGGDGSTATRSAPSRPVPLDPRLVDDRALPLAATSLLRSSCSPCTGSSRARRDRSTSTARSRCSWAFPRARRRARAPPPLRVSVVHLAHAPRRLVLGLFLRAPSSPHVVSDTATAWS